MPLQRVAENRLDCHGKVDEADSTRNIDQLSKRTNHCGVLAVKIARLTPLKTAVLFYIPKTVESQTVLASSPASPIEQLPARRPYFVELLHTNGPTLRLVLALLQVLSGWAAWEEPLRAADVIGLYDIEIPAEGNNDAGRVADFRRALEAVLHRVVKQEDLAGPIIQKILEKPEDYILEYGYADQPSVGEQPKSLLRVKFNKNKLNSALRSKKVAVWASSRPEVLVWLAIEDQAQRRFLTDDSYPELRQALLQSASKRGIPILLPLLDLTDQQSMSLTDIVSGADQRIRDASARYGARAVVAGQLVRQPDGQYQSGWRIYQGTTPPTLWQGGPAELHALFDGGTTELHKILAASYASANTAVNTFDLRVTGVRELREFTRLQSYLRGVAGIKRVTWTALEPDAALFKVRLEGDRSALEQAFALGSQVRPAATATQPHILEYELLQ